MARILITAGPTRQYLDPVRYLSNASSGKMGAALAAAVLAAGHEVVVVSGPVAVVYPEGCQVLPVTTTEEMLERTREQFRNCQGVIAAAAPCDFRPTDVAKHKLRKSDMRGDGRANSSLILELVETPDILAALGEQKSSSQWSVGFALETESPSELQSPIERAVAKLYRKRCDLIVLNGVAAIDSAENQVRVLDSSGAVVEQLAGNKSLVAEGIFNVILERLVHAD